MVFSSLVFLFVFLPIVVLGYYLLDKKFRNIFLLAASLLFYAWGEPRFVFIMIGSILMNYVYALLVDKFREKKTVSKVILTLMVLSNCVIFFIFKYLMFTVENINGLFKTEITVPEIALPIGISFFTFQAISYVIDIYREKGKVQKNPLNVGLYIAFFPQLIAGPIVRYETVAKEINNRTESFEEFSEGLKRFIVGVVKKILLANQFAIIADRVFEFINDSDVSIVLAWFGAICYTLQIFFDFSGYSDMAIGLGKMLGFHFNENFNYPYCATSVTDFWRRWHISLSSWFRDYVYIPLGGSRVSRGRNIFNLFVVWAFTGIWHGANWTFIAWGLIYFVALIIEKTLEIPKKLDEKNNKVGKVLYRIATLLLVMFCWVLFNSSGIDTALIYIGKMFGIKANSFIDGSTIFLLKDNLLLLIMGIIFSMPTIEFIDKKLADTKLENAYVVVKYLALFGLFIMSVIILSVSSYNPFIYFNF